MEASVCSLVWLMVAVVFWSLVFWFLLHVVMLNIAFIKMKKMIFRPLTWLNKVRGEYLTMDMVRTHSAMY